MSNTSDNLISSIKTKASVPTSQNLFTNQTFLDILNEELLTSIVPQIMSVKEEYFVADYDITVTSGTNSYSIPERAIGGKLRDVQLVSSSQTHSLPRLFQEDDNYSTSDRFGFYIKGNKIIISPTPTNSTDTLRLSYYRRPSKLVLTSACAQITSIDTANNQVTVSSLPSTITVNTEIDIVKNKSGFECLEIDKSISGISGTTITFSSLPTDLSQNDWICLAGESPIAQIPQELHPVLTQAAVVKCLESMGDNKWQVAEQKLQQMKEAVFQLISPRVDGESKKIINPKSLLNFHRR
jgi:hypothetical protein